MVVCASGSERKPSSPAWVEIFGSGIAARLPGPLRWFAPFVAIAAPAVVDLTDMCSSDPPDFPEWTAAELAALLNPILLSQNPGAALKLKDSIHNILWYEYCQCTSPQTTPTMPVPTTPVDIPVIEPGRGVPCDTFYEEFSTSGYLFGSTLAGSPPTMSGGRALPTSRNNARITFTQIVHDGINQTWNYAVIWGNASNQVISASGGSLASLDDGVSHTTDAAVPATATQWVAQITNASNPPATWRGSLDVKIYCGTSSPGSVGSDCCPPDPALLARLERIEVLILELGGFVESSSDLVTLIQRQGVPFAYVPAGEVTGLSGSGELAVSGLLAFTVELTTLPNHYGMAEGSPDALFEIGYVTPGTPDGFMAPIPIRTSPFFVRVGADVTRIGYQFGGGIVATIKYHEREP